MFASSSLWCSWSCSWRSKYKQPWPCARYEESHKDSVQVMLVKKEEDPRHHERTRSWSWGIREIELDMRLNWTCLMKLDLIKWFGAPISLYSWRTSHKVSIESKFIRFGVRCEKLCPKYISVTYARWSDARTVEDVAPGIHMVAQYGHSDRGWARPMTPDGIHTDYLLRKTSWSFHRDRDRIRPTLYIWGTVVTD